MIVAGLEAALACGVLLCWAAGEAAWARGRDAAAWLCLLAALGLVAVQAHVLLVWIGGAP